MKKLLLTIIVFLAFFAVSFTINTGTVNAETEATVTCTDNEPYYVIVYHPNVKITFEYDGPGGRIISVMIEHID